MRKFPVIAAVSLIWICAGCGAEKDSPVSEEPIPVSQAEQEILLDKGDLRVLFKDNSQSPQILSGLQSLFNAAAAPEFDAFDPDTPSASAGLNFEHIISGQNNQHNKFSPRKGPYSLHRLENGRSVVLRRDAADSPWQMASTLTYTLIEPHYIDFDFKCTPRDASLFGSRGHALLFFANYMNDVADAAIHFRGISEEGAEESWISADAPKGPSLYEGGGTYRHKDAPPLLFDEDLEFNLNSWSYDWPKYSEPLYYGLAAKNMVFILMFDRAYTEEDEIRFSVFKFKLNRFPRPAWDFQYVIHKVETGKEYGFKGRLVWKRYIGTEDCLEEYRAWKADRS
jgi:hypothetical protein